MGNCTIFLQNVSKILRSEIEYHLLLPYLEVVSLELLSGFSAGGLTVGDLIVVEVAMLVEEFAAIHLDINCL